MNVALKRGWTTEQFLDWAETQDARHEFDGTRPLAMTDGNARHSRITANVHAALRGRLRGTGCSYFGPDLGVATIGSIVRFHDALVTCATFPDTDRLASDVRIDKVRESAAVPSIRRYVIVESRFAGLMILHRQHADEPWTARTCTADDTVELPEIGLAIPVAEIYDDVVFAE